MNVLDSPLEALPFNYYFTYCSNNLWTCLALITAALSFWKIRSSSPHTKPEPDYNRVLSRTEPATEVLLLQPEPASAFTKQEPLKPVAPTEEIDGVRKGKFTVHYEEEGCSSEREGLLTMTVTEGWNEEDELEWWENWERVLRLRNGENENGWYTCQDLTELHGNVVRLWDGGLRFRSSSGIHVW